MRWKPLFLAALLTTTVAVAVAPTASADCASTAVGPVGPYDVRVHHGDCLHASYHHPAAYCPTHVDAVVYQGSVLCHGRVGLP